MKIILIIAIAFLVEVKSMKEFGRVDTVKKFADPEINYKRREFEYAQYNDCVGEACNFNKEVTFSDWFKSLKKFCVDTKKLIGEPT